MSCIKGLAVFHVGATYKIKPQVNIIHANVTDEEILINCLTKRVDVIWKNVNCDEIRVGIAHIEQEKDKYSPYMPLKTAYQGLHFKWKTLTNDEEGKRILILGLNRPVNALFLNPR